jgi:predicted lipoprotein with Yx(FWY)xxD motif
MPRHGRTRAGSRLPAAAAPAVAVAAVAAAVAGCGSSPAPAASATHAATGQRIEIMEQSVSGVGTMLVTSKGYALYMFQPDNRRAVTCTGTCAGTWPPVMLPAGATPVAGPGVHASLLGSDPDPTGGRVLTYNGWPLYTYSGDVGPGQANGQGIDLNGGEWYVMSPSGQPEIPQP